MGNRAQPPLIFAHRGASAHAPENTLAAFELAIQQAADLIEMDAKLSADQQVVLIHDRTVDRTTDGTGRVSDLTLVELKRLNASHLFRDRYPQETIPTLQEALQLCAGRIKVNLELGNYATPFDLLPEKALQVIEKFDLGKDILVSAFHPIPLRKFHSLAPEIEIGLLARKGLQGYLSRSWLGRALIPYDALHPEKSDVTRQVIERAHRAGYRVNTFTVNAPLEMEELISIGVDGLITDDPQQARTVTERIWRESG